MQHSTSSTVKPRYNGHRWDQKKCPYYRVSLLSGLILRKMYGTGPRKLSVIASVRIKRVSVEHRKHRRTMLKNTKFVFCFLFFQDGARIADSVTRGKVASTLEKGSWIDMGNFKGTTERPYSCPIRKLYDKQSVCFLKVVEVIFQTRESVFHQISKH